ncbi:hypothetical protein EUTSA_v10011030mg [Eutrema salsugineum]|uniref:Acetolactate synthase n=1 Tax=Eutrema salsugineum TaxID=72664 RepID=V4NHL8_EUTSA|nr:acetolactate synthase 1, chloroplastic [Eutrema salsugineum]ESQ45691.1 hypothetical protein EUTSA_v10011030mg [Eutrema salsugineum]
MAAATTTSSSISFSKKPCHLSSFKSPLPISRFCLPFSLNPHKPSSRRRRPLSCSAVLNPPVNVSSASTYPAKPITNPKFASRYAPDEPRKGADILVEALERQGVDVVFAYPGGASMEIHQALTQSSTIRNVLPRHEQGGIFAAEGYGTVYANYSVEHSDLLLAFGVRFDDRVTGKLEAFASRAKIVHIDIDSAEIGKNKTPHVSVCGDVKLALQGKNKVLENRAEELKLDFGVWRSELNEQKQKFPLSFKTFGEAIPPQYAIQVLDELTDGKAIISTGVGQHQMWAAQFYKYRKPRQWLSSGGLGAMGFGLPAAIGASVANPDAIVVDIDGDGSFIMNVQELATARVENLPVKVLLLNNQHLGMVMQCEDRFYKANRAHSYLGDPANENEIFPNMLKFAEACGVPAARVTRKEHLREAIQTMLDTPGPYLLDVICPHQEHVLPMIPSGGTFNDVITEGDGRTKY